MGMGMGMAIMGSQRSLTERRYLGIWLSLPLTVWLIPSASARVFDFNITPTLSASQMYSDNLRLQPSGLAHDGFVTQMAPGINITRDSANSKFNLNYRLQYILYEGIDINPRTYNQLQMTGKTEIYDDAIFIDSTSTIGQGNAGTPGAFSPNNVAQSSNVNATTYKTFRLSPYWLPHLGGYIDGEVRATYLRFDNSASIAQSGAAQNLNGINNLSSNSYQESIYLRTGKNFDAIGLTGRISLNNQEQYNVNSTLRFRSANAELNYRLIEHISAFIQVGNYDNLYSGRLNSNNGSYITPGLAWTPDNKFSLAVGYGINAYFANLTWNPSQRTSLQISYRNSHVGGSNCGQGFGGGGASSTLSNTACGASVGGGFGSMGMGNSGYGGATGAGFASGALGASAPGSTWNGNITHRTRASTWTASYYTTVSTIQQWFANQSTFTTPTDINGNPIGNPSANDRSLISPIFTDGAVISKRAQMSVSWLLARNTFMLSANQNDVSYSTGSFNTQKMYGFTASWSHRVNARLNATIQSSWQSGNYQTVGNVNQKTEYLTASFSLNHQLSRFATGSLQFNHFQVNSGNLTNLNNTAFGVGSYDTNQVSASLNMTF
jgi:hypothetical protein